MTVAVRIARRVQGASRSEEEEEEADKKWEDDDGDRWSSLNRGERSEHQAGAPQRSLVGAGKKYWIIELYGDL